MFTWVLHFEFPTDLGVNAEFAFYRVSRCTPDCLISADLSGIFDLWRSGICVFMTGTFWVEDRRD